MAMTAIRVARLQSPSRSRVTTRLPDFLALMKPRVMSLAVFTALLGLIIAPGDLDPLLGSIAVLAIAAGAGAAGVLNMWYDADIDAVMARTAMRPIPLFAALLASNSANRWSPPVTSVRAPIAAAPLQAQCLARSLRAARCPISVRSDEV